MDHVDEVGEVADGVDVLWSVSLRQLAGAVFLVARKFLENTFGDGVKAEYEKGPVRRGRGELTEFCFEEVGFCGFGSTQRKTRLICKLSPVRVLRKRNKDDDEDNKATCSRFDSMARRFLTCLRMSTNSGPDWYHGGRDGTDRLIIYQFSKPYYTNLWLGSVYLNILHLAI